MGYKLYGKPNAKGYSVGFNEGLELLCENEDFYRLAAELNFHAAENELDNYWSEFRIVCEREIK